MVMVAIYCKPKNTQMNIKSATLIAIIGQVLAFLYWQCSTTFEFYTLFGSSIYRALGLLMALVGQGSLILFLIVLYSKQK
jgi:hypothetical protein